MDPNACFLAFVGACDDGDYDCAADAQECYEEWTAKGGFKAKDTDGAEVFKLDIEQDRYLVIDEGIERWRKAARPHSMRSTLVRLAALDSDERLTHPTRRPKP